MTKHIRYTVTGCSWGLVFPLNDRASRYDGNSKQLLVLQCNLPSGKEVEHFITDAPTAMASCDLPPAGPQPVLKFKVQGLKDPVIVRLDQFNKELTILPKEGKLKFPRSSLATLKNLSGESVWRLGRSESLRNENCDKNDGQARAGR
jgi:hypothetical protein